MKIDFRASDRALRTFTERRLRRALRPFADRIQSVAVYLRDVNGPRGGIDKRIRVVVRLRGGRHVVVDGMDANGFAAAADVLRRVRRTVRRTLQRRSALRRRTGGSARAGASGLQPPTQVGA